jgi:hypothetical protein
MSVITDVVIITSCYEKAIDEFNMILGDIPTVNNQQVRSIGKSDDFGGRKVSSIRVYGAAFNYVIPMHIIETAEKVKWKYPKNVAIYIDAEYNDEIIIWTPDKGL